VQISMQLLPIQYLPASKNRNATENKNIQFNYLPGTQHEVETIVTNAKNTNWKIQSYST
jgi:hypothetical protein